MRRVLGSFGISVVALALLFAGCGSTPREVSPVGDGGLPGEITGDALFSTDGPPPDLCKGPHCASDLHSFVDCSGNVLRTCPADQGCTVEGCAPACESAKENKSSVGCDYYVPQPDVIFGANGGCFAAFVANSWSTPVTLTVEYDGATLDASKFGYIASGNGKNITYAALQSGTIPPGEVGILFLSQGVSLVPGTACPASVTPAVKVDAALHGTGIGRAFRISASAPVAAFDIFPYGGGQSALTSATLLLPTSSWDTNYVTIDAWGGAGQGFIEQPVVAFVAQEDATEITIQPSAPIVGGNGVEAASAGVGHTYTIARGQTLQFTQPNSIAGSIVQSNKPVGLWGGKTGLTIDSCCGESAHQQIPPVRALGSEYVGARYRNRYDGIEESPPWRVMGAVDGTVLSWDPAPPIGAPTSIARGQIVQFNHPGPFVVRSQDSDHPFYVSAHMTGAGNFDSTGKDGRGDAEFVNVVASLEYLSSYVFFADPTYPETNLVVVRRRGANGFADVTLDCAGPLTGWTPVGTGGRYEMTRFDLVRHDFERQGNCDNGRHEMHSANAFGLTVWGWGSAATGAFNSQYVSYAFPAGAGISPINTVVLTPIK